MLKHIGILAAIALTPGTALAGSSTTTGTASAEVPGPVWLLHVPGNALNFGKIAVTGAGTVTVTTAGTGTRTGGVTFAIGSTTAADRFEVHSSSLRFFSVTSSGGTVASGGNSMPFTTTAAITQSLFGLPIATFFSPATIRVGGTLTVGANQPGGIYTGTYPVTVSYN